MQYADLLRTTLQAKNEEPDTWVRDCHGFYLITEALMDSRMNMYMALIRAVN